MWFKTFVTLVLLCSLIVCSSENGGNGTKYSGDESEDDFLTNFRSVMKKLDIISSHFDKIQQSAKKTVHKIEVWNEKADEQLESLAWNETECDVKVSSRIGNIYGNMSKLFCLQRFNCEKTRKPVYSVQQSVNGIQAVGGTISLHKSLILDFRSLKNANSQIFQIPETHPIFGIDTHVSEQERFQELTFILSKFVKRSSEGLKYAQKSIPRLSTVATIATGFTAVGVILSLLVGEVDQLYKKMKQLEKKIFSIIIEGKLQALSGNMTNLQDPGTSEGQKVAEIVSAVANLSELLPIFSNPKSIYRKQYYSGAPLVVRFSTILGGISFLADETQGYNGATLPKLKLEYRILLEWYTKKCIGVRMASCYLGNFLTFVYDWERHFDNNKDYDYGQTTRIMSADSITWNKYAKNLGGKGWRIGYKTVIFCYIVDTWDPRSRHDVQFEPAEILYNKWFYLGGEIEMIRNALQEYRKRVKEVMEEFFNEAAALLD